MFVGEPDSTVRQDSQVVSGATLHPRFILSILGNNLNLEALAGTL